jgi:hypothetical protein
MDDLDQVMGDLHKKPKMASFLSGVIEKAAWGSHCRVKALRNKRKKGRR